MSHNSQTSPETKMPKAARTAKGMYPASLSTIGMTNRYTGQHCRRKQIVARGPTGEFSVAGKAAMTLEALLETDKSGATTLELSNSWALRLVSWHARYVRYSTVTIMGEIA